MVVGLEQFRRHFSSFSDQYVLIGGTACTIIMQNSGLDFRATKDLDIVLYVEALSTSFVTAFWQFIKNGGYTHQQRSTGKEIFYRFSSPRAIEFPFMLELFSRTPDTVTLVGQGHLTPIPMPDSITSLSAILLDEDYYRFIHSGKKEIDGLTVLEASHLIPLKARACIDLENRKHSGPGIDEKDIRKHRNDIIRLYQLLSPNTRVDLPLSIKEDVRSFLMQLKNDTSIECKNFGLKHTSVEQITQMLRQIYSISAFQPQTI
jgi:hypothetical protein